jgi:hypothetical protein
MSEPQVFLVGADPELFVHDDQANRFVSAYGMIKGDKANPTPVKDGAVQVDGMALEFNIDPAGSEAEFVHNINSVVAQLSEMVPSYRVMAVPVAHFGEEYIKSQPLEATELGCNPDYNAYTGLENERPNGDLPFRTGAGHVHIGWTRDAAPFTPEHFSACCSAIKQLDVFLGIPSVIYDGNVQRREMYGKPGAFRPKPYGVEYRVLSNVWVGSKELQAWVYRATQAGMKALTEGRLLFQEIGEETINGIINKSDVAAARAICEKYGLEVPV